MQVYALDIPPSAIRAKVRQQFDANKGVHDLQAVDVLLARGHMEYQEMMNVWKMGSHVMRYFDKEEVRSESAPASRECEAEQTYLNAQAPPQPVTFMEKFLCVVDHLSPPLLTAQMFVL